MLIMENVVKNYDNTHGIFDINLTLQEGKVYSVIGPNGSGKTTLIKSMAGMMSVSDGKIELDGINTILRCAKAKIGYAIDENGSYPNMSIYEILDMANEIKFNGNYQFQMEELLQKFSLWESRHLLYKKCSLGMKKKLGLCISFLGNPSLILLDEPTNGIDTKGIICLKKTILEAKENTSTIVITSHVLDFVKQVADENIFLKNGRICCIYNKNTELEQEYERLYM